MQFETSEQVPRRQHAEGQQLLVGQSQGHSLEAKSVGVPQLSYTRAILASQESSCYFYCINKTSWFNTQLKNNDNNSRECGHCYLAEVGENLASQ